MCVLAYSGTKLDSISQAKNSLRVSVFICSISSGSFCDHICFTLINRVSVQLSFALNFLLVALTEK